MRMVTAVPIGIFVFLTGSFVTCARLDDVDASAENSVETYREIMDKNIGLCVNPTDPSALHGNEEKWQELVWGKMDAASPYGTDGWANNAWGKSWLPNHMMIGLVRNDEKYPSEPPDHANVGLDSECFLFDYSKEDGPDPAGCRVFSKSFAPLQSLRACIVNHLDQDQVWTTRRVAEVSDGNFSGSYDAWCEQAIWGYVAGGKVPVHLCGDYDSIRRAEEMIKFVLFKPLPDDFASAAKQILAKIHFTVTWPKGQPSLEERTARAIREQCFQVQGGQTLMKAAFLQRISPCLPLMFDKAEIQGFGINDGIMKFQGRKYYGDPAQNFHQANVMAVPSLCGRLALATIPGFQSAKYQIATITTLQNDRQPGWDKCVFARETNCRRAYFCWESALNRICGISAKCCPGDQKKAAKIHRACKENPDGKIVNTEGILDVRVLPNSLFGLKLMCPREMGTGN